MYKVNDIIRITNGKEEELIVEIVKVNLDGTFEVKTEKGTVLRIYKDDIIEN